MRIRSHLFYETSHSPSLIDLVGVDEAATIRDFCFIANPYFPTPEMMERLIERFPTLIKSYPSSNPAVGASHLADVLDVDPENLIIGNGATELITTMCDAVLDTLAVPVPTFGEYLDKIERNQLAMYRLDRKRAYRLDLDTYLAWLRERGIHAALVINPGNPTGQTFERDEMESFLRRASSLDLVIVDESFIDFADEEPPSLLPVADRFSNLILVRSMSKHCGVPGLRLGYCYANNRYLLNRLRRHLPTWNINTLAEYFLSLLPETDDDYHESRRRVIADMRHLFAGLGELPGFTPYPTGANFVLLRIDGGYTATELQMTLLRDHRLYVRDCTNKVAMDDKHVRIATQGREADDLLLAALRDIAANPALVRRQEDAA
jgi:threonine-phosphate decarboxylase